MRQTRSSSIGSFRALYFGGVLILNVGNDYTQISAALTDSNSGIALPESTVSWHVAKTI
jgi:hypothetical protein